MNIEIANRLVNLRKNNGLSQEALAEKLGISRQAVSKWERAEASPDTDNLILLAKIYKISLDELLSTEEQPPLASKSTSNDASTEPQNEKEDAHKFSGIHLKCNEGDIYIGRKSIHSIDSDNQEKVHIKDACYITVDGQDYTFKEARKKWGHKHHHASQFPIALITIFIYISIGVLYNIWHPTWLVFLLIPFSSGIASAIRHKDWKLLPYPTLVTAIYLSLGFLYHAWHPAWVLFLTIPLYYSLTSYFRKRKNKTNT
jgi:transcriptional regulator with XRE-family HTH domain